jgi:alpha-glucosidase
MSRTGLPIMRPVFLEFPAPGPDGEPLAVDDSNLFLFGADLLVADSPYPDEVNNYEVALPPGGWFDYWTGARIEQATAAPSVNDATPPQPTVHLHHTLDTLPVFARAGAIIPQQPLVQSTDEKPQGPLTLRVYPPITAGQTCQGSLYLDDGISYNFQKGDFLRLNFTCQLTPDGLTVTVSPREGNFAPWWKQLLVEVYGVAKPAASATTTAPAKITPDFDPDHHRITALIPDTAQGVELKLVY